MTDEPDTAIAPPPTAKRRTVRWWPAIAADGVLLVVIWALVTEWSGIWGSHPAYALTLVLAAAVAIGITTWAILSTPTLRSATRTWLSRAALVLGALVTIGLLIYLRPLSSDQIALDALDDGGGVEVTIDRRQIRLQPDEPLTTGFAFYPGALVDPRAYAHILRPIAEAGYPVVIYKFPYNLAVIAPRSASTDIGITDDEVTSWVIAGHSLGGAMAASFAEDDRDELDGLLLWAAYPVNAMNERDLAVMSIYGTNDEVVNEANMDASRDDLPPDTEFVAVDGGIHAFFGDYGSQRGDGEPSVSRQDAQAVIVAATLRFLTELSR
jgi:Alpha/beta hydrolase family